MRFLIGVLLIIFSFPVLAKDAVVVDLASNHVDINTGFNGTTLELFGVRHDKGEIAVIVRGPLRTMEVRRKEPVLGAWMNRRSQKFKGAPSYYNYAVSAPLGRLAGKQALTGYGVGPENLLFNKPDSTDKERIEFRQALVRNKQAEGLYAREPGKIVFLSPDFFRADFYVPANVPVGEYEIQTLYFSGGDVKEEKINTVRVAQVGAAANIYQFAHDNAFLYGLLSVVLALFAGWFSNRVRRG